MKLDVENQKVTLLRNILLDLATKKHTIVHDDNFILAINNKFEELYYPSNDNEGFRHFYSDIFSTLINIKNSEYSLEILAQNLKIIREKYEPRNRDKDGNMIDVSKCITKLFDHVNLEISRILYYDTIVYSLSQSEGMDAIKAGINGISRQMDIFEETIDSLEQGVHKYTEQADKIVENITVSEQKYNKLKEKIKNQQKDSISILAIFSAVVLTFNLGSLSYSAIFNNILNTNTLKMLIVSLVLGLVLVNILFFLFYFIAVIIDRKIGWKYYVISNIIMIVFIIIFLVLYYLGLINFMKI